MKAKLLTPQRVICRVSSLSFEEFQSIYAQLCANNFKYKGSLLEPILQNHSPGFHKRLSQKAKLEAKDIDSLKRYAARAAGRSTPFGLFAGGVLAQITQRDHIHLKERGAWLAHTRDFNLNTQAKGYIVNPLFHKNSFGYFLFDISSGNIIKAMRLSEPNRVFDWLAECSGKPVSDLDIYKQFKKYGATKEETVEFTKALNEKKILVDQAKKAQTPVFKSTHLYPRAESCTVSQKKIEKIAFITQKLMDINLGLLHWSYYNSEISSLGRQFQKVYDREEIPFSEFIRFFEEFSGRIMPLKLDSQEAHNHFSAYMIDRWIQQGCGKTLQLDKLDFTRAQEINKILEPTVSPQIPSAFVNCELTDKEEIRIKFISLASPTKAINSFSDQESFKSFCLDIHKQEKKFFQSAIFAEISAPQVQKANTAYLNEPFLDTGIIIDPNELREYKNKIYIKDLKISYWAGRFYLRDTKTNKYVIPVFPYMINTKSQANPILRFLDHISHQGLSRNCIWLWGLYEHMRFLPEVRYEDFILYPARWCYKESDFRDKKNRLLRLQELIQQDQVSDSVYLKIDDMELPINLKDEAFLKMLLSEISKNGYVYLFKPTTDIYSKNQKSLVSSKHGNHKFDFIVPFIFKNEESTPYININLDIPVKQGTQRSQPPFSENTATLCLYGFEKERDICLVEMSNKLLPDLYQKGIIQSWYFVRYADPDLHLRLRFRYKKGKSEVLIRSINSYLNRDNNLKKYFKHQWVSFHPELERYFGNRGLALYEDFSEADCNLIISLLKKELGQDYNSFKMALGVVHLREMMSTLFKTKNEQLEFIKYAQIKKEDETKFLKLNKGLSEKIISELSTLWSSKELSKIYKKQTQWQSKLKRLSVFAKNLKKDQRLRYCFSVIHMSLNRFGLELSDHELKIIYKIFSSRATYRGGGTQRAQKVHKGQRL